MSARQEGTCEDVQAKAVAYQVPREFAVTPAPDPELCPWELLRVEKAGICGTEPTACVVHGLLRDDPACLKAALAP